MAEFNTGEGNGYSSNLLRFATREEADKYANDLMFRWTAVRDYRIVESVDPVKHAWGPEGLVYLEDAKKAPPVAPPAISRPSLRHRNRQCLQGPKTAS